jgi:23S rRNA pseudouridine2605 synthase
MSRRRAEDLIRDGRVTLDGRVAILGDRADRGSAVIAIDGVPVPVRAGLVYYLLNKPRGVISTADDPRGRKSVVDMVDTPHRVYPVGRLDADSEGLLILTNDGTLANLITHPRYEVAKTYLARVAGRPSPAVLRALEGGVELEDGMARARSAKLIGRHGEEALVEIVMAEGRKREVRRMMDHIGHPVHRLVRIAIGPLRDSKLAPGASRALTVHEVRSLYTAAGATWEDAAAEDEQES